MSNATYQPSATAEHAKQLRNQFYRASEAPYHVWVKQPGKRGGWRLEVNPERARAVNLAHQVRDLYLADPLDPWIRQYWAQVEANCGRLMIKI
jgi:hypothetical protein